MIKPVNYQFILLMIAIINVISPPVLAGLPSTKKLIYIGTSQPETDREAKQYVDPNSIQKRGVNIFFTTWVFWKYPQGVNHATKAINSANCEGWVHTTISFAGINSNGMTTAEYKDGQKNLAVPGSIEDRELQTVCSR
jgi:hypothetical protein